MTYTRKLPSTNNKQTNKQTFESASVANFAKNDGGPAGTRRSFGNNY